MDEIKELQARIDALENVVSFLVGVVDKLAAKADVAPPVGATLRSIVESGKAEVGSEIDKDASDTDAILYRLEYLRHLQDLVGGEPNSSGS